MPTTLHKLLCTQSTGAARIAPFSTGSVDSFCNVDESTNCSSNLSAVSKPQLCSSSSSLMDMVLTAIFRFVKSSVQNAPQTVSPMVPKVSLGAWISFKNSLPAHPPIPVQLFIHFYTASFIANKTSISCSQMLFSTFSFSLIIFLSLHFHCLSSSRSHSTLTLVSSIAEQKDNCPALTQILLRQVIYSNHRNFSCHLGDHTKQCLGGG